jgi:pimeloyl-ACP methyl ester carboxylesterase
MYRIESLLSARQFVSPQIVGMRLFFISNLSGHLSLYAMDYSGSVPEPLLPPDIALQNPHLLDGLAFTVYPKLGQIVVMLDKDGDENYLPMRVPLMGGFPEPLFAETFQGQRVHMVHCDLEANLAWFEAESRSEQVIRSYRANLESGEITSLGSSPYGATPLAESPDHHKTVLAESYTTGDVALFLREEGAETPRLLYGKPLDQRDPAETPALNGIGAANYVCAADGSSHGDGLLLTCSVFDDCFGPAYLALDEPQVLRPVRVSGLHHQGAGELVGIEHLNGGRYALEYNIDGCSWLYEAVFDPRELHLRVVRALVGAKAPLVNGMLQAYRYDPAGDRFALAYSTAVSPTQIYSVECTARMRITPHTRERVLGIAPDLLSSGEDASFTSFDGLRVSARLYLPAAKLDFSGPRPLVYYIHGGPQSQERPDFAWFSMPLIQFLTLNGFAVFVPNARGSTGYGLAYTKRVDRDWGGDDRRDHVAALASLANDPRLDTSRAGVVGRSYGGYMTLTLAGRHPELWAGAVDMFGPYDLITFSERIPETWKPYFRLAIGDPRDAQDRADLIERSPRTHIDNLACPMLVIQGKNDPRVVESESRDLVEHLRGLGKHIETLVFENEGHDVLKYENRVRCYSAITSFFQQTLHP